MVISLAELSAPGRRFNLPAVCEQREIVRASKLFSKMAGPGARPRSESRIWTSKISNYEELIPSRIAQKNDNSHVHQPPTFPPGGP